MTQPQACLTPKAGQQPQQVPEPKAQVDTLTFTLQGQLPDLAGNGGLGGDVGGQPSWVSPLEKEGFAGSSPKGDMGANPRWRGGALGLLPPISCFEFSTRGLFRKGLV